MINTIKTISSTIKDKFRYIKFLGFGKSDIQEKKQVSSFGDDSVPLKDMIAILAKTSEKGEDMVIGYLNKDLVAKEGEKRIYSLKEDGSLSTFIHLKGDGTADFGGNSDNLVRFKSLENGFNDLRSDFNELVSKYNAHIHVTTATVSATPVPGIITPTPSVAVVSTADISGAKIDEFKSL